MDNISSNNEKELLVKISEGDESAFQLLFNKYFDTVFSTAFRYTAVRQQAEDAAQQVFMKLWEKRTGLPAIDNLEAYIFTAAKREILGQFRKQSVRNEYVQHVIEVFGEIQETNNPESLLIEQQQEQLYQEAIAQLPARQKQAFLLSREQDMTYSQIATEMQISKETVKEHITNALQSIRAHLLANPGQFCWLLLLLPQKYF